MTEKVFYAELRPEELVERVNECPIAYMPVGTLEWHSYHLPFGVDMLVPREVFRRIASRVGGVVLPPLFLGPDLEEVYGGKPYYGMDVLGFEDGYPQQLIGSAYHIPKELYLQILERIVINLKHNGFSALIGHGHGPSSNALLECKERFALQYGFYVNNLYEIGEDMMIDHAAVNETSLMMALHGHLVDLSRLPDGTPPPAVWGKDPRDGASAEEGERIVARNEERAVAALLDLKKTLPCPNMTLQFHHVKDLRPGQEDK